MLLAVLLGLASPVPARANNDRERDINLVVLVIIDMLKGETLFQQEARFEGGLRYLLERGTSYRNAHYQHATTFTAVGHAVLATGAPAAQHGLAGNDWVDPDSGEPMYCVADPQSRPLLPTAAAGTSPRNLTASTFSDEIVLASQGRGRSRAVSVKDRGAILPAGRLGKAYWYAPERGDFISASYYHASMPDWLSAFNDAGHKDAYRDEHWRLQKPLDSYRFRDPVYHSGEKGYRDLGETFPKAYAASNDATYYSGLRFTPAGDALTLALARQLMASESLGNGPATDVLSISLSAQDYIGHAWGSHSLEYEDNLLQLDRRLGELLDFVDAEVGLDRTLIVLASDHGTDDIPEHQAALGLDAGRHRPDELMAYANDALKERFGIREDLVSAFWNPGLYLDAAVMARHGLDYYEVERALAALMLTQPGIRLAVTRSDLLLGRVPDTPVMHKVQRAFHPERSGHVLLVQDPFWYLYPNPDQFAAMHGSPYAYDTHVPLIFAGPGIAARRVERNVAVSSVAPTIASYLDVRRPSGADHPVLVEVLAEEPLARE